MSNLVDIVQGIINQIDTSIEVQSTDGVRINVCSTLWISTDKRVEDGLGNVYKVTDFLQDTWIDVTPLNGAPIFGGSVVIAPSITFLHGSPSSTNNEYLQISKRTREKTPFIWLLESYEYVDQGLESSIEAAFDARLFFMDETNVKKWINDEHNTRAIKPMEGLVKAFKDVIDNDYSFKRMSSFRNRVRPRFGVEISNQGSKSKIINEDLSGVEVNMTIELYDLSICNC